MQYKATVYSLITLEANQTWMLNTITLCWLFCLQVLFLMVNKDLPKTSRKSSAGLSHVPPLSSKYSQQTAVILPKWLYKCNFQHWQITNQSFPNVSKPNYFLKICYANLFVRPLSLHSLRWMCDSVALCSITRFKACYSITRMSFYCFLVCFEPIISP